MLSTSDPHDLHVATCADFGESHYIGPLHPNDEDVYAGGPTGAQKWVPGCVYYLFFLMLTLNFCLL
jgi:hypothetical protein